MFETSDLDDGEVDPGMLSSMCPTSWTFFVETLGMMTLVVSVPIESGDQIEYMCLQVENRFGCLFLRKSWQAAEMRNGLDRYRCNK